MVLSNPSPGVVRVRRTLFKPNVEKSRSRPPGACGIPVTSGGGGGRVCKGEHLYTKWVRHLGKPRCSLKSEDLDLIGTHVNQRV